MGLRMEFDTRMTALEEQSGRHTTMLQEVKDMLIRMQSKDDDEEDDDQEFGVQSLDLVLMFSCFQSKTLVGLLLLGICLYFETCLDNLTCFGCFHVETNA